MVEAQRATKTHTSKGGFADFSGITQHDLKLLCHPLQQRIYMYIAQLQHIGAQTLAHKAPCYCLLSILYCNYFVLVRGYTQVPQNSKGTNNLQRPISTDDTFQRRPTSHGQVTNVLRRVIIERKGEKEKYIYRKGILC